jgi:hypothetical protein
MKSASGFADARARAGMTNRSTDKTGRYRGEAGRNCRKEAGGAVRGVCVGGPARGR